MQKYWYWQREAMWLRAVFLEVMAMHAVQLLGKRRDGRRHH